jgi:hypothetical protein
MSSVNDLPVANPRCYRVRAAMAGRVSVVSETNSAALSAQAIVTPKAECGPDALPENLKCQLDVCCGQVSFRMAGCDTGSIGRSLGSVAPQVRVVYMSFKNRVDVFLAADFCGDGFQSRCVAVSIPLCGTQILRFRAICVRTRSQLKP